MSLEFTWHAKEKWIDIFKNIILVKMLVGSTNKLIKITYIRPTQIARKRRTYAFQNSLSLITQLSIHACVRSTYLANSCVILKHREEKYSPCPPRDQLVTQMLLTCRERYRDRVCPHPSGTQSASGGKETGGQSHCKMRINSSLFPLFPCYSPL